MQGHLHEAVGLVLLVVAYGDAQDSAGAGQGDLARRRAGEVVAFTGHHQLQGQAARRDRRGQDREERLGAIRLHHSAGDGRYADFRRGSIVIQNGDSGGVVWRRGEPVAVPWRQRRGHNAVQLADGVVGQGYAQNAGAAGQHQLGRHRLGQVAGCLCLGHLELHGQAAGWRWQGGDNELRQGNCLGYGSRDRRYADRRLVVVHDGDGGGIVRRRGKAVANAGQQACRHSAVQLADSVIIYGDIQEDAVAFQYHQARHCAD